MTVTPATKERLRNRRGQGAILRHEIVAAAGRLLDSTGRQDSVTLRAVAREVGIAAPSIYAHFADRDAIVAALVDESFVGLIAAIERAGAGLDDPVARLRAGCQGYLEYARTAPHRYGLLFLHPPPAPQNERSPGDDPGAAAFSTLVAAITACARAGASTSTDAFADATALWVALHGYAGLRANLPTFQWPADDTVTDHLITALARLTPGSP